MSEDTKYNGWTNYETWCVNLWLSNDQGSQEYACERAQEALQSAIDDNTSDAKAEAASTLADELEQMHDENKPEASGVYADLLGAALGAVNWREIAEHYVDDIDLYSAGTNMPGYMPDSDPAMFLDFDDAKQYIIDQIKKDEDQAAEELNEALAEELCHTAEDVNLQSAEFSVTIGNRAYWVSKL